MCIGEIVYRRLSPENGLATFYNERDLQSIRVIDFVYGSKSPELGVPVTVIVWVTVIV